MENKNRIIKFRAWDKNRNRFVENGEMLLGNIIAWKNNKEFSVGYTGDYELMQFTGLHDKNGKEIYENMILDDEWEVIYQAPKYVLRNISNSDIFDIYENKHTITKEYSKL